MAKIYFPLSSSNIFDSGPRNIKNNVSKSYKSIKIMILSKLARRNLCQTSFRSDMSHRKFEAFSEASSFFAVVLRGISWFLQYQHFNRDPLASVSSASILAQTPPKCADLILESTYQDKFKILYHPPFLKVLA